MNQATVSGTFPVSELVAFEDLSARIHPADRDRVKAAFAATRAISAHMKSTSASLCLMLAKAIGTGALDAAAPGAGVGLVLS
jgi:hypothetical protein